MERVELTWWRQRVLPALAVQGEHVAEQLEKKLDASSTKPESLPLPPLDYYALAAAAIASAEDGPAHIGMFKRLEVDNGVLVEPVRDEV